jgi:DNA-binding response OmpR family regulator
LVEDDPQVRQVTARTLRAGGYEIYAVDRPEAALSLPDNELCRIRLLITDVVMPGIDGRTLAKELCRRHPGLQVLYVSGYTHEAIDQGGVVDSGIEFLAKPFTASSLLSRVRAVLDGNPRLYP